MDDRISQYRQFRLNLNASPGHPIYTWRFSAIQVRKGVPHAVFIDGANFPRPVVADTPEAGITATVRAALDLSDRWTLL